MAEVALVQIVDTRDTLGQDIPEFIFIELLLQLLSVSDFLMQSVLHILKHQDDFVECRTELSLFLLQHILEINRNNIRN